MYEGKTLRDVRCPVSELEVQTNREVLRLRHLTAKLGRSDNRAIKDLVEVLDDIADNIEKYTSANTSDVSETVAQAVRSVRSM